MELLSQFALDSTTRSARLSRYRLTSVDQANLVTMGQILRPRMGEIVDAFYAHLERFPEAIAIIQDSGSSIEKLKKTNPRYFEAMFSGKFDEAYFESRLRIGQIHAHIGLTPEWFFAGMSTYHDTVTPILVRANRFRPGRLAGLLATFQKTLNLDTELIIEAYVECGFVGHVRHCVSELGSISSNLSRSARSL